MRKHTKRKIRALINPITFAIEGACITTQDRLNDLRVHELASIEAFAKGRATLQEWHDMTAMLNIAETMAMYGVGKDEVLPVCQVAQAAIVDAARRYESTKKMGVTGTGLVALRDLYQYHDLQRSSIPRSEYERYIQITTSRIKSGAPEVKVIE